jgi:2-C-methyl-D-erythritol 4-phosphate cytidylyltransferase / 2-C-methyl-D-erythritol 2,4-cyclodiphosphate synthase
LLAWSVAALAASPLVERIALVRSPEQADEPRPAWLSSKVVSIVAGGARRQDSVRAGIEALDTGEAARVLLVHDGARPLVSTRLVEAVAAAAAEHGAAIPVVPVAETLKRLEGEGVAGTVDRTGMAAAQTPQGIRWDVLREALERVPPESQAQLTDEASLLEAAGFGVRTVPGEASNIKVTLPGDLALVEARLGVGSEIRTGFNADGHAFGPGLGLRLGGVEVAAAPRLHGHSDGDAALHAIAGALLGAAALGDLGGLYPADARTPAGVDSGDLLRDVAARLGSSGWEPRSVDLLIRAARPALAAHLPAMREAIAGILGLEIAAVSVKAATGNLSGDAGAGRTIEAEALVGISRSPGSRRLEQRPAER